MVGLGIFTLIMLGGLIGSVFMIVKGIKKRSPVQIIAGVLAGPLIAIFGVGMLLWATQSVVPGPVTDPHQYTRILSSKQGSALVAHFPKSIPSDATRVKFYFSPGPMQAPTIMQLRYKLPPEQITALSSQFTSTKLESFAGGEAGSICSYPPMLYAGDPKGGATEFPQYFDIYILQAKPGGTDNWNHNDVCGVAISKKRQEIVYWAEAG